MAYRYGAQTEEEEQWLFEQKAKEHGFLGPMNKPGLCGAPECNCSTTDKHIPGVLALRYKDGTPPMIIEDPTEGLIWQLKECHLPFFHRRYDTHLN